MSKSNDLETQFLNHTYRTNTFTKPTNQWVALFTADPAEDGSGAEVTGGGYARVQVACADASWSAPADDGSGNMQITNAAAVTFPTPSGNWTGPITHFAMMSASTGGVVRHKGALGTPRTVNNGDTAPTFAIGDLVIKEG